MAAELWTGVVTHKRWHPAAHGFAYDVSMVMVDIGVRKQRGGVSGDVTHHPGAAPFHPPVTLNSPPAPLLTPHPLPIYSSFTLQRLDEAFRGMWPLAGVNCAAVASFKESDHLKKWRAPGQSLDDAVRAVVADRTGSRPAPTARILLLTHLQVFGYCFNPVSFYYIYNANNTAVQTIIAEVSNTPWNEMHLYVLNPGVAGVEASVWEPLYDAPIATHSKTAAAAAQFVVDGAVSPLDFAGLGALFDPSASAPLLAAPVPSSTGSSTSSSSNKGSSSNNSSKASASPASSSSSSSKARQRRGSTAAAATAGGRTTTPQSESESAPLAPSASASSASASAASGAAAASAVSGQAGQAGQAVAVVQPSRRLRYRWHKEFHVSPFMALDQWYDWIFTEPGDTLLVQSGNSEGGRRMFNTQLRLTRHRLTLASMLWMLFWAFPFLTWRLQAWIHWEALRLWWKGVPLYDHPDPTANANNAFTRTVAAIFTPIAAIAAMVSGAGKAKKAA